MKLLFKFFTLAVILFATITSCNKEKIETNDLKADFEKASLLHTEAMEDILATFKTSAVSNPDAFIKITTQSINRFVTDNPYFSLNVDLSIDIMNVEADRLFIFREEIKNSTSKQGYKYDDFLLSTIEHFESSLTAKQKELLLIINDVLSNETNLTTIISLLTEIKDVDCLTMPVDERNVIYAATTIGIESVSYWAENLDVWVSVITNGKSYSKVQEGAKWFSWGSVGKSDVAGAIGGALAGAITGGGAGIGAIGGAVACSGYDAVIQVLNHYF